MLINLIFLKTSYYPKPHIIQNLILFTIFVFLLLIFNVFHAITSQNAVSSKLLPQVELEVVETF
jgi:hypothetical protein